MSDRLRVPNLRKLEREIIELALERYPGRKPEIAAALGVSLKTLYNKLNEYGTRRRKRRPAAT